MSLDEDYDELEPALRKELTQGIYELTISVLRKQLAVLKSIKEKGAEFALKEVDIND